MAALKNKRKAKIIAVLVSVILVAVVITSALYIKFFTIWGIKGQKPINSVSSPDGRYTVTAYLNDGGATTSYCVLAAVKDNKTGFERNIYWQEDVDVAYIDWVDETTVIINAAELDVQKDTYDYRKN